VDSWTGNHSSTGSSSTTTFGSNTKVWTATQVMQLVDAGRIDLDDPIRSHVPGFRCLDRSSISLITKDYPSKSRNVLVMGFANDTLGYMTMVNQHDLTAAQGLGLLHNAAGTANYEEALSLGPCNGEIVLNAMLEMGAQLGVMGEGESP
jgi:hypothetical protein